MTASPKHHSIFLIIIPSCALIFPVSTTRKRSAFALFTYISCMFSHLLRTITTNCRQYASIVLAIMLYMEWSCRNSVIERHLSFSAHPTPTDTHTLSLAGILAQKKRGTSHAFPIAVYLLLRMSQPEGLEQQIYMREATHFSTSSILAVGSNLATTLPFLSTTNLVKFHLISGLFL